MNIPFNKLPKDAKIWIYQSKRELTDQEVIAATETLKKFTESWQAHGADLHASFKIIYNRFIVIAVDENGNLASGCSIDNSVQAIKALQDQLNTDLLDRMGIVYKDENGKVIRVSKIAFKEMLQNGSATENTIVFNNMLTSFSDFKDKWEVPVKESWHKRMLG